MRPELSGAVLTDGMRHGNGRIAGLGAQVLAAPGTDDLDGHGDLLKTKSPDYLPDGARDRGSGRKIFGVIVRTLLLYLNYRRFDVKMPLLFNQFSSLVCSKLERVAYPRLGGPTNLKMAS